jgi:hypothetical protein
MKIICSQDELLAKLQIAARGVSQRSTVNSQRPAAHAVVRPFYGAQR